MKKILSLVFLALGLSWLIAAPIQAQSTSTEVEVYVFVSQDCPHCHRLKADLTDYVKTRPFIKPHYLEVTRDANNRQLMEQTADKLNVKASGVPWTVIGDRFFFGYSPTVERQIKQQIDKCAEQGCSDLVKDSVADDQPEARTQPQTNTPKISLPVFGEVDSSQVSLPLLTAMIGLIDGFNPCAMWALIFIITLLIGLKDRQRMWAYGVVFIITSAVIYFLFLVAWLNVFKFIGFVRPLQIVIGLLALVIGGYYLYDYQKKEAVCKVTNVKSRQQFFEWMKQSVQTQNFWLGLVGVVALAAVVNLVELACSAGLPAIYTAVLTAANLSSWQYHGYLLLYVLFFMLDDLVVFAVAMKTMRIVGADSKYSKLSRLVGGILMLVLGGLLIFAPQILMFG